jgi:hypothetical protein
MRFFLFGFSEPGGSKQGFKWASHRCRKKKVNEVLSISPDSSRFFHTSHGPGWTGPDLFRSTYGAARPNNTACRTNQNPGAGSAEAAPPWPLAFAATVSHATAAAPRRSLAVAVAAAAAWRWQWQWQWQWQGMDQLRRRARSDLRPRCSAAARVPVQSVSAVSPLSLSSSARHRLVRFSLTGRTDGRTDWMPSCQKA